MASGSNPGGGGGGGRSSGSTKASGRWNNNSLPFAAPSGGAAPF